MNAQILALVKQAVHEAELVGSVDYKNFEGKIFEKFAELIVRECMEQVRGEFLPVLEDKEMMKDTHWDGYVQCGVDSVVAIREHFFGVEE
jgi:hypothetical protein